MHTGCSRGWTAPGNILFEVQKEVFATLLKGGADTIFGSEHGFSKINSIQDFQRQVPVRDYNALYPYIERLRFGENYVL